MSEFDDIDAAHNKYANGPTFVDSDGDSLPVYNTMLLAHNATTGETVDGINGATHILASLIAEAVHRQGPSFVREVIARLCVCLTNTPTPTDPETN